MTTKCLWFEWILSAVADEHYMIEFLMDLHWFCQRSLQKWLYYLSNFHDFADDDSSTQVLWIREGCVGCRFRVRYEASLVLSKLHYSFNIMLMDTTWIPPTARGSDRSCPPPSALQPFHSQMGRRATMPLEERGPVRPGSNTHTYIHIYICVCVCVCVRFVHMQYSMCNICK